jgi:hypothetical protein
MVDPFEKPGAFNGQLVSRTLDHAKETCIPAGIGTDITGVLIGDVKTCRAELNLILNIDNTPGQAFGQPSITFQDKKGDPRGGFLSDTRKFSQLVNQFFKRRRINAHDVIAKPVFLVFGFSSNVKPSPLP